MKVIEPLRNNLAIPRSGDRVAGVEAPVCPACHPSPSGPGRFPLKRQPAGSSVPVNLGFRVGSVPASDVPAAKFRCFCPLPATLGFQVLSSCEKKMASAETGLDSPETHFFDRLLKSSSLPIIASNLACQSVFGALSGVTGELPEHVIRRLRDA